MKVEQADLAQVLSKNSQYRIPRYQRRYQWESDQWSTLWDDIFESYKQNAGFPKESGNRQEHFFGAIVRRPARQNASVQVYDLIDGQQRLATIILVLSALSFELKRHPPIHNRASHHELLHSVESHLFNVGAAKRELIPRLVLSREDDDDLNRILQGNSKGHDGTPLDKAFEYFRNMIERFLQNIEPEGRYNAALGILKAITHSLSLALLTLDEFDQEYDIFESLNAKGMHLEESDKVRNYCFLHLDRLSDREVGRFHKDHWLPMEKAMIQPGKKSDSAKLLNRFMMSWTFMRSGWVFAENKLYSKLTSYLEDSIKREFGTPDSTHTPDLARHLHPYFMEMTQYASAFACLEWPPTLTLPGHAFLQKSINAFIKSLGLPSAANPLLLHLLHCHMIQEGRDPDALKQCLDAIESYVVRRYVCGISKGVAANQRVFSQLSNQMYKENFSDLALCHQWLTQKLQQNRDIDRWPDDEEFLGGFDRYECSTRDSFALYVLREIEATYGSNSHVDIEKTRVARVLPEELTSEWSAALGVDAKEVQRQWFNKFGNCFLTSGHTDPYRSFEQFKAAYRDSELITTREICLFEKWNAFSLRKRSKRLFEMASVRWSIPS